MYDERRTALLATEAMAAGLHRGVHSAARESARRIAIKVWNCSVLAKVRKGFARNRDSFAGFYERTFLSVSVSRKFSTVASGKRDSVG